MTVSQNFYQNNPSRKSAKMLNSTPFPQVREAVKFLGVEIRTPTIFSIKYKGVLEVYQFEFALWKNAGYRCKKMED